MQRNQFLDYPEIASLTPIPEKLLVLLHGLGSDGNDLINLVPFIQKKCLLVISFHLTE